MAWSSRTIRLAGARLRFRELGQGPAIVFLHGAGGAESALPCLARLVDRHRLLVPDHFGFGASDRPAWLQDVHDLAYATLDFLEALDLTEVHLVGTSLGGWIALEAAVRDRSRLRALTLIGAAGIDPGDVPIGDLFAWDPAERVRQLVAEPAIAEALVALPQTEEQRAVSARNFETTALIAQGSRFVDPQLERWLHRLRLSVHVIWGERDALFPLAYGRRLARLIPGARLSVIPGCGHLPQVENPERLAALIAS